MDKKDKIFRLLNYKNLLNRLKTMGFKKVFSDNISDSLDISSSLVRKDFGFFEIKGSQKGGYDIDLVLNRINEILGKNEIQKIIVIGIGRIGEALLHYKGFTKEGFEIVAGFDIDLSKISPDIDIPVYHISQINDFVSEHKIEVAILAVPQLAAQQSFEIIKSAGIKGLLNFTNAKLISDDVYINSVNIINELEKLFYLIKSK